MKTEIQKVRDELQKQGVKITPSSVIYGSDHGNQVYARGDYAGLSVDSLARGFAANTGRKIKYLKNISGGL